MLPLKLAIRYFWSGRFTTKLVTVITFIGIFLASFSLVFTVGIMNGFEKAVKEGLLKNLPHIQVYLFEKSEIPPVEEVVKRTLKGEYKNIFWYSTFGLVFEKGPNLAGVTVFSSDREILQTYIFPKLGIKNPTLQENCLFVGEGLAARLDIEKVPTSVLLIDPVAKRTPVGFLPKIKRFKICGIYSTSFAGYDNAAVGLYNSLSKYFEPNIYSLVIELKDPYKADYYRQKLSKVLKQYYISTWIDSNRDFFSALKLEKLGMILVVGLISIVAAFNVTALLFMKVKELRKDFAIFRTFGAERKFIIQIVLLLGGFLSVISGGVGVLLSLLSAKIFTYYKLIKVPEDVYLTPYLPVEPGTLTAMAVFAFVFVTSLVAAYIPALLAAKEKITDILRNE